MGVQVLNDIPVPPGKQRNGKYPWLTIDVGSCFLVEKREKALIVPKNVKVTGKKFRQVVNPDIKGEKFLGLGVWRVS